jgi:hypothetical protein
VELQAALSTEQQLAISEPPLQALSQAKQPGPALTPYATLPPEKTLNRMPWTILAHSYSARPMGTWQVKFAAVQYNSQARTHIHR